MVVSRARKKARHLFGGGLIFFTVGIVLDQSAVMALAIVMLVGAGRLEICDDGKSSASGLHGHA